MTSTLRRRTFLQSCISGAAAISAFQFNASGAHLASLETPLERKGASKKVIVVGAGLAGLSAAYELTQAGHEVTVLEVRLQPGGRVRTLREPFSDGLYAEAGARLFSDSYKRLLHYAKLFELEYAPMPVTAFPNLFHVRGKRLIAKPEQPIVWPFDITDEEQAMGPMGILGKYIVPVVQEIGDPSRPDFKLDPFFKYDKLTFSDLMRSQGASDEAVELVCKTSWFGPGAETTSAMHYLVAYLSMFYLGQGFYAFPGGNDCLPRAFAARLKDRIHYGAPVVKISHDADGVEAVFERVGANHSLKAQHLILAVPFSHLRYMEVSPALSAEDQALVEDLNYAAVVRIYLQVSQRFWEKEGVSGSASTDLPIMEVAEQPLHPPETAGKRTILEALIQGPEAERLGGLEEKERIEFAIAQMEKVHPGIRQYVEGGTSKFWGHGAYSEFEPGQMTAWFQRVARPEGPIHFAGEHTSMLAGTMEGALESGQRAAREVNDAA